MSRPKTDPPGIASPLVEEAVSVAPTNSPTGWVVRWVDPSLPVEGLSRDLLEQDEIDRLHSKLAIVLYASQIPRRLGGDATAVELAEDKRRCRRAAWALKQAVLQWTPKIDLVEINADLRSDGATLEWQVFGEDHLALLTTRTKRAATWAVLNGERKWGARFVTRVENERRWITHALR